jgi:hypothetical protein
MGGGQVLQIGVGLDRAERRAAEAADEAST